jgi:hypothetical protein
LALVIFATLSSSSVKASLLFAIGLEKDQYAKS